MTPARRLAGEPLGTALLLAAVVGSGIMGERLSGGNVAIALLANTLATGAMLVTLIFTFAPISGAHFNPAVTLADASQGGILWREVPGYIAAQVAGALLGVAAACCPQQWRLAEQRRMEGQLGCVRGRFLKNAFGAENQGALEQVGLAYEMSITCLA